MGDRRTGLRIVRGFCGDSVAAADGTHNRFHLSYRQ
jgi:hypothetical protein